MKFIKVWLLVLVMVMVTSTASAWECGASSNTGAFGVGFSSSRGQAASIALHECRMRTPNWGYCSIDYCRW